MGKQSKKAAQPASAPSAPAPVGWTSLGHEAHIEFTERKSVFLGHAMPVTDEKDALAFLGDLRHRYADATHNVYAYILRNGNTARYSDDGEPQGTAGMPVLDVLRKRDIVDAVLVVTRYFGGILLGGGGLVRAYGTAASMAADAAGVTVFRQMAVCRMVCDYTAYQRISAELASFGAAVTESDFDAAVRLTVMLPDEAFPPFLDRIRELTAGRCIPEKIETRFTGAPAPA